MPSIKKTWCLCKNRWTQLLGQRHGLPLAVGFWVFLAAPVGAQSLTDDIKVGDQLTAAGIAMRGYSPQVMPLPPGNWEVVARSDENLPLINRLNEPLMPSPKVVLTLRNKELLGNVIAAVVSYSPEVVRIRWTNPPCQESKADFAEGAGTTPDSLNYACAKVWYIPAGFKRYIASTKSSDKEWEKKYLAPLASTTDAFPDPAIWMMVSANRDSGRQFEMILMGRSTMSGKVDGEFDRSIRSWVNTLDKVLIAGLNGDKASIPEFPAPPLP